MAKKKKTKSEEEIVDENEFLKMKMMAEFGGDFFQPEGLQLPPEVENVFLKQVNKFHKVQQSAPVVSIYEIIGKPDYNHANDLNDKELIRETKRILSLLNRKKISVETLSNINIREFYRFITEDVFKKEIQDLKLPNWYVHYVYEEFYPSDEFDLKMQTNSFAHFTFEKEAMENIHLFHEDFKDNLGLSSEREDFLEKVSQFKQQFNQLTFSELKINHVVIDDNKQNATVEVNIEFKTQSAKGKRFKINSADFILHFSKMEQDWEWLINRVESDLF